MKMKQVDVWLSDDEFACLEAEATARGMTLSGLVRSKLEDAHRRQTRSQKRVRALLPDLRLHRK